MTTLYEGAYAKLNLTLDVLGKREDGYHDLQSVMQTISIRDDIEIDLDTRLTPAANAQRYYKKYSKSKSARSG